MNKRILGATLLTIAIVSFALVSLTFNMQLIPDTMNGAIPGQMCVFLATIDGGVGKVRISANAPYSIVSVEPSEIIPGQVAEITVIPSQSGHLALTVRGERFLLQQTKMATFEVSEGEVTDEEPLGAIATEIRDSFIPWLATNYPEFGITDETEWTGTIVRPNILVVMFYLFFSGDWEMGVSWHVTIPPHNWARIYLRHRYIETQPSYAFEIASWSEEGEPYAIDLADAFAESLWR